MADIFISYSRKDLSRVRTLADALANCGWSVWWDRQIPAGHTFDEVIAEALADARCVVVVWSNESIASSWVREEAEEGRRREILIPVLIDGGRPPLGFGRIQAVDLADWNGDETADAFQKLVNDLSSILGPPPARRTQTSSPGVTKRDAKEDGREPAERRRWRGQAARLSLLFGVVLALLCLAVYWLRTGNEGHSQPRATIAPSAESGLRLTAVMSEDGEPLERGVSYEVEEAVKDAEGNRTPIASSAAYQPPPRFALPAGRYYVTAAYGSASASTEVTVNAASLTFQTLNLRVGVLRLSSVLETGTPPIATGVLYQVYEASTDVEGNRKRVVDSPAYQGPPRFPLAAGRYYVTAAYGSASGSTEIDIAAGENKAHTLNLRAGVLNVSSVAAVGTPPLATGVSYEVYEAAKDVEGNRKKVADSPAYQGPPRFVLPAGRYHVLAAYGSASAGTEVDLAGGEIKPHILILRAGLLDVSSVMVSGGEPLAKGVQYEVYEASKDPEGKRQRIADSPSYQGPPRFVLPAGRYHITAVSGQRAGNADVAVAEGKVHQVRVRLSERTRQPD